MRQVSNSVRAWAIEMAACMAVGALLGLFGPFGSFLNDVLVVRVAYWVIILLLCGLAYGAAIRLIAPPAHRRPARGAPGGRARAGLRAPGLGRP